MIDDYSVPGVNDYCTIHTKLDLHVVDTFVATVKSFFQSMKAEGKATSLLAKTYDLKSAYRQIPIRVDHRRFAYFCIYNPPSKQVEIYRSLTLPFGATHSVYSFLRLARMLHRIACRGAKLLTTNFYDDFILASPECLQESAKASMELVFPFTGWDFARDGKKATDFAATCNALGVTFNLADSKDGILEICNTAKRVQDLVSQLNEVIESRDLPRHAALRLRGRLGFADGFLHGRLGALVLKRLIDHAYGHTPLVDDDMAILLSHMRDRLLQSRPKKVDSTAAEEWVIFTDASYDPETKTGGLGAILVAPDGSFKAWFSKAMSTDECLILGSDLKHTIIYELELLATCVALEVWSPSLSSAYPIHYGDNDSVRYALIRGTGVGIVAETLMRRHLEVETVYNSNVWFARVPTEANIADLPSRFIDHELLTKEKDRSDTAAGSVAAFVEAVSEKRLEVKRKGVVHHVERPTLKKR
eukprot:Skav223456  [mRNA]  locus=scaffold184:128814:130232:- [translate_table: standard]